MFNDILVEFLSLFFSVVAVIAIIVSSIIIPILYRNTKRKNLKWIYSGIIVVSIFVILLYIPWFFKNKALNSKADDDIIKYDIYAAKTAILPPIKGYMYDRLAGDYLTIKKDLDKGIKYQELACKYSKDSYDLYFLSYLYEVKGDYDKALNLIESSKGRPSRIAKIHFLKGDTNKALEILNKAIEGKDAGIWEYMYRANIYDYLGKSSLAQKDYKKAIEINPEAENYPIIKEIRGNKNYQFDAIKKARKLYNIEK